MSPYLTWYWSEFLMFRAEYQHKAGDVKTEDSLWFQCDFVFRRTSAAPLLVGERIIAMKPLLLIIATLLVPTVARANLKIVTTTPDSRISPEKSATAKFDVHSVMRGPTRTSTT